MRGEPLDPNFRNEPAGSLPTGSLGHSALQHAPSNAPRRRPAQLQASWVQASPGDVQMPQLALQQTSPAPQVLTPHSTPPQSSTRSFRGKNAQLGLLGGRTFAKAYG